VTLRLKLFLLMAGITVFPTTGVTAVALWRDVRRGQELLYREGAMLAGSAAPGAARFIGPEGPRPEAGDAIEVMLQRLVRSAPLDRAWAVDKSGAVVACVTTPGHDSCSPGMPSAFDPAESPVQALLRLVEPEGIVASAPILRDDAVVGAVRVDFAHEEVVGSARRLAWSAACSWGGRDRRSRPLCSRRRPVSDRGTRCRHGAVLRARWTKELCRRPSATPGPPRQRARTRGRPRIPRRHRCWSAECAARRPGTGRPPCRRCRPSTRCRLRGGHRAAYSGSKSP